MVKKEKQRINIPVIKFILFALILLILVDDILIIIDNNINWHWTFHVRNRLVGNKFGNVTIIVISRPLRDSARIYSAPNVSAFIRVDIINLAIRLLRKPVRNPFGSSFGSEKICARISVCGAMTDLSIVNTIQSFHMLREGHARTNLNLFSTA